MKTILGTKIPENVRGVLYLCVFDKETLSIEVEFERLYLRAWDALMDYANIPNPESQVATGATYEELCKELKMLHANMNKEWWLKELSNSL